jgi:adenylate cyclase class 2
MNLEVEVKFFVSDLSLVRQRLLAMGAEIHKPRVFERNIRYDNGWNGLQQRGAILRLRQDTEAIMTYKGIPDGHHVDNDAARIREELEVTLSDFDMAHLILERLGFEAKQTYEKHRETFSLEDVEIVLDEMPYGDFVELEGDVAALHRVSTALGLDWERRILANYLGLLEQLNQQQQLLITDLTFDNFPDRLPSVNSVVEDALQ